MRNVLAKCSGRENEPCQPEKAHPVTWTKTSTPHPTCPKKPPPMTWTHPSPLHAPIGVRHSKKKAISGSVL